MHAARSIFSTLKYTTLFFFGISNVCAQCGAHIQSCNNEVSLIAVSLRYLCNVWMFPLIDCVIIYSGIVIKVRGHSQADVLGMIHARCRDRSYSFGLHDM